jgi:hypothetical protein
VALFLAVSMSMVPRRDHYDGKAAAAVGKVVARCCHVAPPSGHNRGPYGSKRIERRERKWLGLLMRLRTKMALWRSGSTSLCQASSDLRQLKLQNPPIAWIGGFVGSGG